jgi:hypothetical protein
MIYDKHPPESARFGLNRINQAFDSLNPQNRHRSGSDRNTLRSYVPR